jgi:hypothetical protein
MGDDHVEARIDCGDGRRPHRDPGSDAHDVGLLIPHIR